MNQTQPYFKKILINRCNGLIKHLLIYLYPFMVGFPLIIVIKKKVEKELKQTNYAVSIFKKYIVDKPSLKTKQFV